MSVPIAAASAAAALFLSPAATGLKPAPALEVPPGFRAEVFATGLEKPTALAFGPDGLLYATQEGGEVVAVGRGSARPRVLARGFRTPLGLAWSGDTLFVSTQGSLHRLVVRGKRVVSRRAILSRLPYGRHQQDTVAVGPDGRLYVGSGSTCDACRQRDRRSAAIFSVRPDGTDLQVFARGLRNPFGLAFQPGTGRLYASDNGRDDLGESEPAETIVLVRHRADYGWPGCWASWRERRLTGSCRGVTRPVAYLEPHSSASSLAFWRTGLFVAEWGQYLSERWGRKLVRVNVRTGRATTFATGFDHPLGLAVEPRDGGLLAGDWGRGVVYRFAKR
ncbi:MAG: PQQ-dependent sugar dehydrogenase [Actinobacteria bacterium]|nr:PQQ-dependent sugar dehydrogenase [Actinomycetota bacterium]